MSATQQAESPGAGTTRLPDWSNETVPARKSDYRVNDPRRKSPFMAGLLSLLPGVGQVYVGYYRQGFLNILIAGSVFSYLLAVEGETPLLPLGILFLIFYELYNIIDAARRATLYNLALEGIEEIELPDHLTNQPIGLQGSFLVGGALMLFGVVALSNSLLGLSLTWLENWWPMAPIGLGAYLFYMAYNDNRREQDADQA